MVYVLDKDKKPLMPCTEKRARLLLERHRARVHRVKPFVIRLVDRTQEESTFQPIRVKLDPGSKTTGLAVVIEPPTSAGSPSVATVVALVEVHHNRAIKDDLLSRRGHRRWRRNRYRRYRPRRFNNRPRTRCHVCGCNARAGKDWCRHHKHSAHDPATSQHRWLPPSLRARVLGTVALVERLSRWCPVTAISVEDVRFDTQAMQRPGIAGAEYQRGELAGYEIREYLNEKHNCTCAYCKRPGYGPQAVPLEIEHIVPVSRGGSNRISNLTLACRRCNQRKGNQTAAEFGFPHVQAQAKIPLRDAAIATAPRYELRDRLRELGLPVECGTGGMTRYNRRKLSLEKSHAFDALCVGLSTQHWARIDGTDTPVLHISRKGRGNRQMRQYDKRGFLRLGKNGKPISNKKRQWPFATGDLVNFCGRRGRISRARADGTGTVRCGDGTEIGFSRSMHAQLKLVQHGDGYEYQVALITAQRACWGRKERQNGQDAVGV